MEDTITDKRFAHIKTDPKFRRIPKNQRKVKIDTRFQSMFQDKKFAVKYTIDKRGRPMNQTSTENLRKYYELSNDDSESDNEVIDPHKDKKLSKKKKLEKNRNKERNEINEHDTNEQKEDLDNTFSSNGKSLLVKSIIQNNQKASDVDTDLSDMQDEKTYLEDLKKNEEQLHMRSKDENVKLTNTIKEKLKDLSVDYARGDGILLSDSSSEEEDLSYSDESEEIEHDWGELDKEAEVTNESTCRLAVCNMDWDRIRAVDLMVLFNSFLLSGGLIHSVTIYLSEFGQQRIKEEEIKGPTELIENRNSDEADKSDNEEGSGYHMEKLRKYQLNRLKYFYAVVVCDSIDTANKIYTECDGLEYESTATKLDLRFIPDDMTFDQEPREVCNEMPELSKYQPRQFITTALQQVKVALTWDETNPERQEITQKLNSEKLHEVHQNDLETYLASASSDENTDTEGDGNKFSEIEHSADSKINNDPIEKYKSLLKAIEEEEEAKKQKDVELEFTWDIGTKEKSEQLVKEKQKKKESLTPFEQYLEKRKNKKKTKRKEQKDLKEKNKNESVHTEDSEAIRQSDLPSDEDVVVLHKKRKIKVENDTINSPRKNEEEKHVAELELLLMDTVQDKDKHHFNMKKIEENTVLSKSKQKRLQKKKSEQNDITHDDFEVNVKDERFAALYSSHHFNIDPADPRFRKTKGTEAFINEKLKKRINDDVSNVIKIGQPMTNKKMNVELQALVKSVKRNVQTISQPIK